MTVRIYINKIGNRLEFEIKRGLNLDVSSPETMKLLGSIRIKITKDENGENAPHLKTTEVVLVHCNIASDDYQDDSNRLANW